MESITGKDSIIFDLDGTLLDTIADLAASTNYALSTKGYPTHPIDDIRRFVGNGIRVLVKRAAPGDISPTDYEETFAIFRRHYVDHCAELTRPYPGIPSLLSDLKQRGYKLAIVSNKLQPAVTILAQRFFRDQITVAIGEGPSTRRKPAPDSVLQAIGKLHTTPSRTLYVGDSEIDIETASRARTSIVSVSWGFRKRETLQSLNPRFLIDRPSQLLQILPAEPAPQSGN